MRREQSAGLAAEAAHVLPEDVVLARALDHLEASPFHRDVPGLSWVRFDAWDAGKAFEYALRVLLHCRVLDANEEDEHLRSTVAPVTFHRFASQAG